MPQPPYALYVGDERCHFFGVGAGDSVGAPGVMKALLRGESDESGSPSRQRIDGLAAPDFVDRGARLVKMDEQHVEACLMLSTTDVGIEPQLRSLASLPADAQRRILRDDLAGLVA